MVWLGIFALCIVSFAGNVNAALQLIKGKYSNIEDFPYQVSIQRDRILYCGGAIVSDRHIVTAGQCVKVDEPINLVRSGTSYPYYSRGIHRQIARVHVHPNFTIEADRYLHDIAVITLRHPIVFDDHQKKINITTHNYRVGDKAIVTGWGLIKEYPPILANSIHKLETVIMSREECQRKVFNPQSTRIHETEICTERNRGSGICLGDYGGPLVVDGVLVGVASWNDGEHCASPHPDVYTNVYKYEHFIKSIINNEQ